MKDYSQNSQSSVHLVSMYLLSTDGEYRQALFRDSEDSVEQKSQSLCFVEFTVKCVGGDKTQVSSERDY